MVCQRKYISNNCSYFTKRDVKTQQYSCFVLWYKESLILFINHPKENIYRGKDLQQKDRHLQ